MEIKNYPRVIVVILNWNGINDTLECIRSIKLITYTNYELIIVDNGSTDSSSEIINKQYPNIEIIENKRNLGYAEGNNVGIRLAIDKGADYVLLLNNDTIVDRKLLDELINVAITSSKNGFIGPKVYYYNYKCRNDVINFAGGKVSIWRGVSNHIGINQIDNGQFDQNQEVDYIEGSCVLVKTDMIKKIGYLNSDMFTYWEDIDWCIRGSKAGYKSIYAYKAKIWHKIGSYKKEKNRKAYYYYGKNIFIIIKQHANILQKILFILCLLFIRIPLTFFVTLIVHRDIFETMSYIKGSIEGIKYVLFNNIIV